MKIDDLGHSTINLTSITGHQSQLKAEMVESVTAAEMKKGRSFHFALGISDEKEGHFPLRLFAINEEDVMSI